MPGAGQTPAGIGPAGQHPPDDPERARLFSPPLAPMFDIGTRDFKLDTNGDYVAVHPVDQEVELRLSIRKGSIASAPDVGSTLRDIPYVGDTIQRDVEDAVRVALARLLDAGDIEIVAIDVQVQPFGGFATEVRYRNLRAQGSPERKFSPASL